MPRLELNVVDGLANADSFTLDHGELTVGREVSNGIVLDDGEVSRNHARIGRAGDEFFVEDVEARNPTLVNDRILRGRHTLRHGDSLVFGGVVLLVDLPDRPAPPPRPTAMAAPRKEPGPPRRRPTAHAKIAVDRATAAHLVAEVDDISRDWAVLASRGMPDRATSLLHSLDHNQTDFRALYELGRLSQDIAGVIGLADGAASIARQIAGSASGLD